MESTSARRSLKADPAPTGKHGWRPDDAPHAGPPGSVQVAAHDTLRLVNRRILLSIIADKQPISRADISKASGMNKATVSAIVADLLRDRYVIEESPGRTTPVGGKPPIPLRLNPSRFGIFGVDITTDETTIALSDFNGQIVARRGFPTEDDAGAFLDRIGREITAMRNRADRFVEFAGAGVSLPGLVDERNGRFIMSVVLPWRDVAVAEALQKTTRIRVCADSSARCAALAEIWHSKGHFAYVRNLLYVGVSSGLSCGLVIDGSVYRGGSNTAGQFGHMSIDWNGPPCPCGLRGCWDLYASDKATLARYREAKKGARGMLMTRLMDRVESGEPEATQVVRETARYLGVGLAGLVNGLEPQMIVIGGEITRAWGLIEPIIASETKRNLLDPRARSLVIRRSAFDVRPTLKGALTLILNELLSVPQVG